MIKLCPELIAIPLNIIFEKHIQQSTFLDTWKRANVQPVHKKTIASLKQIIGQFLSFLFLVKSLKKSYLMAYMTLFALIIFYLIISPVFALVTLLSTNSYLSLMIFLSLLKTNQSLEQFFLIFLRPLTRFGMMVCYISFDAVGLMVIFTSC